jgi:hypothetical protein
MVTSVPYQLNSSHDNPITETNESNKINEINENREDDASQLPVGGS